MGLSYYKTCILFTFVLAVNSAITGIEKDDAHECAIVRSKIDIDSSRAPLILHPNLYTAATKHGSHMINILSFLYPMKDTNCYYARSKFMSPIMRVACPDAFLLFPDDARVSKIRATTLYYKDGWVKANESSPSFVLRSPLTCSDAYDPMMRRKDEVYEVGYQINLLDFLPTYRIIYDEKRKFIKKISHAKIVSVINARANLTDIIQYRTGLIYEKMGYGNLQRFYTPEYQLSRFQNISNATLNLYFKEKNYLIPGQLISSNDFYYNPQQRSTFFYENTAPIWKSINKGNWRLVGEIIRKLAQETKTDFEVLAGAIGQLSIEEQALDLGVDKFENMPVPKLLFKLIVDISEPKRGIVFVTINNPNLKIEVKEVFDSVDQDSPVERIIIPEEYVECKNILACEEYHPEFILLTKGYTYCCELHDFNYWHSVKGFLTVIH